MPVESVAVENRLLLGTDASVHEDATIVNACQPLISIGVSIPSTEILDQRQPIRAVIDTRRVHVAGVFSPLGSRQGSGSCPGVYLPRFNHRATMLAVFTSTNGLRAAKAGRPICQPDVWVEAKCETCAPCAVRSRSWPPVLFVATPAACRRDTRSTLPRPGRALHAEIRRFPLQCRGRCPPTVHVGLRSQRLPSAP